MQLGALRRHETGIASQRLQIQTIVSWTEPELAANSSLALRDALSDFGELQKGV